MKANQPFHWKRERRRFDIMNWHKSVYFIWKMICTQQELKLRSQHACSDCQWQLNEVEKNFNEEKNGENFIVGPAENNKRSEETAELMRKIVKKT